MYNPMLDIVSHNIMKARAVGSNPITLSIANSVGGILSTPINRHSASSSIEDHQFPKSVKAVVGNELMEIVVANAEEEAQVIETRKVWVRARNDAKKGEAGHTAGNTQKN